MLSWIVAIAVLVVFGALLAMAEAATTHMSRVRVAALVEEGRRNAEALEKIEADLPRHLNAIYLAVMVVQNGSAVLVAVLADRLFGDLGVTLISVGFTLGYFVVVEAMSKTFAVLRSDAVALNLAPFVRLLCRALDLPTRLLIGLANVLLPGRGLEQGPFASQEAIRWMAEVGHEEGSIAEQEKELIHSVFRFGDTVVREVMKPRPDIVAIESSANLRTAQDLILRHGYSRIPIYRDDLDHVEGVLYAKDVLKLLAAGKSHGSVLEIARPVEFVPESKRVAELLPEMQRRKFHIALVTDEFGSVSGLVTLEDLLEELVGEITDEYDREELRIEDLGEGRYRVNGRVSIDEVNHALGVDLPQDEWDTIGGLVLGALGEIPSEGREVSLRDARIVAEKVVGRRIVSVLVTKEPAGEDPESAAEGEDGRQAAPSSASGPREES